MLTQSSLQGRSPWNQRKAKSIIDHRKATRCEIEAPAINAGCGVTLCEGPMRQSGLRRKLLRGFMQFAPSQCAEQVARKNRALTLPARKPFLGQMFDPCLESLTHFSTESHACQHRALPRDDLVIEPGRSAGSYLRRDGQIRACRE